MYFNKDNYPILKRKLVDMRNVYFLDYLEVVISAKSTSYDRAMFMQKLSWVDDNVHSILAHLDW